MAMSIYPTSWANQPSITTLFMLRSSTAPCFGSRIRSCHQADKVLKNSCHVEHIILFLHDV
jgi:hypothetical protein